MISTETVNLTGYQPHLHRHQSCPEVGKGLYRQYGV
jgi:hypothetical protein